MIALEVKVPGNESIFEVNISEDMYISDFTDMLIKALQGIVHEDYNPSGGILCDGSTGNMLNVNMTAGQIGLKNGSQIIML